MVCAQCLPGSFAQSGLNSACTLCPGGTAGNVLGAANASIGCASTCTAGYACPPGSNTSTALVCPAGTFSLPGAAVCTNCGAGLYGASPGLTTVACSGPCNDGRYGVPGQISPLCTGDCAPGSFCVAGVVSQCAPGQYSLAGAAVCTNCSAGLYGASTGLTTAGCSGQCAAGRFGSVSGLSSSLCEGACSAGYRCPLGSVNATAVICGVGQYSLAGSSSCTQCPSSTPFSSPGSGGCYAACPDATWTAWLDSAGVEGAHSCFKLVSAGLSWTAASAACKNLGGGSHLLTSRQVR
jgi:hypothetical protein